jgi:hypothetical protein
MQAGTVTPTFTANLAGTYVASLVVNDGIVNSAPATVIITAAAPFNVDTGVSLCYGAGSNVLVACDSAAAIALNPAQDGMIGLDVSANNAADGKLGFSYTAVAGGCVQDNLTGLMWEVKTTDGGLRDWAKTYTNLGDNSISDSSTLVTDVNASNLCGFNDWRLPTVDELQSILDYSTNNPSIDASWFPNTQSNFYWSSTYDMWGGVRFWAVEFNEGGVIGSGIGYRYVRLVRVGQ